MKWSSAPGAGPLPDKAALVRRTYKPCLSVSLVVCQEGEAARGPRIGVKLAFK
jgi:hypothetical protein